MRIELTGSYAGMFNILAAIIGLTAFAALATPRPESQITKSPAH